MQLRLNIMDATIRLAVYEDLSYLSVVEIEAAERFSSHELNFLLRKQTLSNCVLQAALKRGLLWVAVSSKNAVVGFLVAEPDDGVLHIVEMSVLPSFGRQGIGTALLQAAIAEGRARGFTRRTLTTFVNVAWNAPYYHRMGFQYLSYEQCSISLQGRLKQEEKAGLLDRVAMCQDDVVSLL